MARMIRTPRLSRPTLVALLLLVVPGALSAQSPWFTSVSGAAFGLYTSEGTRRGAEGTAGSGWVMATAAHDLSGGVWSADAMLMLDPVLRPTCGYPRLLSGAPPCRFARGEDRAPVHPLVSGLGTRYERALGRVRLGAAAALAGDPALGADPWFHRPRAETNPVLPLTQHEITPAHGVHGVVTGSAAMGPLVVEGSLFNGSTPDDDPYDLDLAALGAWSARLRWQPAAGVRLWAGLGSFPAGAGHAGHAGETAMAVRTAGLDAARALSAVALSLGAAGARHEMDGNADDAVSIEATASVGRHGGSVSWEWAERAEQTGEMIELPDGGHDHRVIRVPYTVSELSASYGVELIAASGAAVRMGGRYARTFLPALLESRYQTRSGNSFTVWMSVGGGWASGASTTTPAHVH